MYQNQTMLAIVVYMFVVLNLNLNCLKQNKSNRFVYIKNEITTHCP